MIVIISALWLTILTVLLYFMTSVSGGTTQLSDGELRNASREISSCQLATLRLGSEIADLFNSLSPEDYDTADRIYQDFILEHLSFAPWMSHGIRNTKKSLTGSSTERLRERGGWNGSAYDILNNKWIYMFGDSTTRQVWASYVSPLRQDGESFESNAKEWTRHNCESQFPHRKKHSGHSSLEERWEGPCHVNEHSCHVTGYGERGRITFDWKHFPFEDYDEYLFSPSEGPWSQSHRPDLFTVQTGLHSCWHSHPESAVGHFLNETNHVMLKKHKTDIFKLMGAIRRAIDSKPSNHTDVNPTTVIVLTSGQTALGPEFARIDACIQSLNRVTSAAAMLHGFAVLDRGEVERRLMSQSYYSDNPFIRPDLHLLPPAQQLIATLLLHLYRCVEEKGVSRSDFLTSSRYPLSGKPAFRNWNTQASYHR